MQAALICQKLGILGGSLMLTRFWNKTKVKFVTFKRKLVVTGRML